MRVQGFINSLPSCTSFGAPTSVSDFEGVLLKCLQLKTAGLASLICCKFGDLTWGAEESLIKAHIRAKRKINR